jgi:hypothetical protein
MGIEPTAQAWEAWVLPLYDARAAVILFGSAPSAQIVRPAGRTAPSRFINPSAAEHRALDLDAEPLLRGYRKWIVVENHEIGQFPGFDRALVVLLEGGIRAIDGSRPDCLGQGDALCCAPDMAGRDPGASSSSTARASARAGWRCSPRLAAGGVHRRTPPAAISSELPQRNALRRFATSGTPSPVAWS